MTPAASTTLAEVAELFRGSLAIEVPGPDTDLLETGRLDSVGLVELLLELERRFGVQADMEDLELGNFRTLRAIAAFVAARRGGALRERSSR